MQIAPVNTGTVGGVYRTRTGTCFSNQEVTHPLGRCPVAAADLEGSFLNLPLPVHTAQGSLIREVRGIHRYQQSCVSIFSIPVRIAHAIGDHPAFFGGCRHHITAGTHAEGINRTVIQMLHQLIVRRGQHGIYLAILGHIHGGLPVLNADTHGKGLGFHGNAGLLQHGKGIPGAVTDGQHRLIAFDGFPAFQLQAGEFFSICYQAGHLGIEADFTAQRNDPLADILDHCQQNIGAHMGLGIVEDLFPGTGFYELLQDPADSGIVDAGVQLAVRKCTGAAFTELNIAPDIQFTGFKEFLHLFMAALGILPPLQHQRLPASQCQDQSRKHTRRTEANHHRPLFRSGNILGCFIVGHRCSRCPLAAAGLQDLLFISFHRHIDGVDNLDIRLFPGVHTAADDLQLPDFGVGDPQQLSGLKLQLMGVMLRRERNIP